MIGRSFLLALAACVLLATAATTAETNVVAHPPIGTVIGVDNGQSYVYRGIPYAQPPVGALRWADTQPAAPFASAFSALKDGAACPQTCILPPHTCPPVTSEDCLYINVFTPRTASGNPTDGNWPVMVFFHGGNFYQGYGGGPLYDGTFLTNTTNVVLVTVNYRLGALGFLGGTQDIHGNYGYRDQVMALQWVQHNIKAFGGDAGAVTIFGQSAGAASVSLHLTGKPSRGLFHKAIMESHPIGLPLRDWEQLTGLSKAVAGFAGCDLTDTKCMLSLSAEEVLAGEDKAMKDLWVNLQKPLQLFMPFTPCVAGCPDGLFPEEPFMMVRKGMTDPSIPIMMGVTEQEAVIFVYHGFEKPMDKTMYDILLAVIFGLDGQKALLEAYPLHGDNQTDSRPVVSNVATDCVFKCLGQNVSRTLAEHHPAVYFYEYDHVMSFGKSGWGVNNSMCWEKVCHGAELPFIFHAGTPEFFNFTAPEYDLSVRMQAAWTNFAKSGNPNVGHAKNRLQVPMTQWPPVQPNHMQALRFQTGVDQVIPGVGGTRCTQVWDEQVGYRYAMHD